jgi:Diacylglycerol kinase catalytic domain
MPHTSFRASGVTAIERTGTAPSVESGRSVGSPRLGVIHNARARRNVGRELPSVIAGCDRVMPQTLEELYAVLGTFVDQGVDSLVIDGGDGTVRDVLTTIARHFAEFRPRIAVVPSGKTNALALDLGISIDWSLEKAVAALIRGRIETRSPIEVWCDGDARPLVSGFIFGAGAFVRATEAAQKAHRIGAFNGLAVGLSIAAAVAQTVLGRPDNPWRRGEEMRIARDAQTVATGPQYLVLASTLRRMPLGIKPFGPERAGLKMLRIDAPASHILQATPMILAGRSRPWLEAAGYHRDDADVFDITLDGGFIIDGEAFPGGVLSLRQGAPISFALP